LLDSNTVSRGEVDASDEAALRFAVDDMRIGRIDGGPEAVAAVVREPVGVRNVALSLARPAPGAVVLRTAADVVRHGVVVAHGVELADREHVEELEVAAAIPTLRNAAVVANENVLAVIGVDPHRVVIDVDAVG